MPSFCAVVGCASRGNRDKNSFFRIPGIPQKGQSSLITLKTKRRMKWILALRRADMTETKLKYAVICDRHFISGRPASLYDIENPDWVPSINMGYSDKPRKSDFSPHIEYIRSNVTSQNEFSETAHSSQSSCNIISENNSLNEESSITSNSLVYQNKSSEENAVNEGISPEGNTVDEEMFLQEFYPMKENSLDENTLDVVSSDESTTDKFVSPKFVDSDSGIHQNVSSKKVQTDLTMNHLDKISEAFKANVLEVNRLKAKLKSLTGDILHLNEIYC